MEPPEVAEPPKSSVKKGGRSRRRQPRKNDDEENGIPNLLDWKEEKETDANYRRLDKEIRRAEERTSAGAWKSHESLRAAVLGASSRLAALDDGSSGLLLHEHESCLIKMCRSLVKQATESTDDQQRIANLLLATHTMRALCRRVTKATAQEGILQLLYHAMTTLDTVQVEQNVSFEALEALYHILLRYKKITGGGVISCATVWRDEVYVFPIPLKRKATEESPEESPSLDIDKVCTIVIQCVSLIGKKVLTLRPDDPLPDFLVRLGGKPIEVARQLFQSASAWTSFQVKATRSFKEGLSHRKRFHRILWDHAGQVSDPVDCLGLRRDAIAALLPNEKSVDPLFQKALESRFAETTCTCAWKASTAYFAQTRSQTTRDSTTPLWDFHETIGKQLDRVFDGRLCLSYLEYCSQRAQHVGVALGPPLKSSEVDPDQIRMKAMADVAFLVVAVCEKLSSRTSDPMVLLTGRSEQVSTVFRMALLESGDKWPWSSDEVSRIFKIIPLALLHKSLYSVSKAARSADTMNEAYRVGAFLMTKCLGLFFLRAAKAIKSERTKFCEKAVDCMLRGVSALESEDVEDQGLPDQVVGEFVDFVLDQRLVSSDTAPLFEKFAKFLSSSARQREERSTKEEALSLHLMSLRLLTDISRVASSDLMLSHRWTALSSLFLSTGKLEASILASTTSLLYDAFESPLNPQTEKHLMLNLFGYICGRSKGLFDLSQYRRLDIPDLSNRRISLIAQLLNTFQQIDRSSNTIGDGKTAALTSTAILECLGMANNDEATSVSAFLNRTCNVSFRLSSILRVVLPRNTFPIERSMERNLSSTAKVKLLIDIIVGLGTHLVEEENLSDDAFQEALSCHRVITRLAINLVEAVEVEGNPESSLPVLVTGIYCVAAASILPAEYMHSAFEFKSEASDEQDSTDRGRQDALVRSAHALIKSARTGLASCTSGDWRYIAEAMTPVLLDVTDRFATLSFNPSSETSGSIQQTMERLVNCNSGDISEARLVATHLLVSFLSNHGDSLQTNGERFAALQLLEWIRRIAALLDRSDSQWFEASFLKSLSPRTIISGRCSFDALSSSEQRQSLAARELQAYKVRCNLLCSPLVSSIEELRSFLEAGMSESDQAFPTVPKEMLALAYWVKGTLAQILAEAFMSEGRIQDAMIMCKKCLRLCKQSFAAASRRLSSFSRPRTSTQFQFSMMKRLQDRQAEVLMRLSSLYSTVGDYRRAGSYTASALKESRLNEVEYSLVSKPGMTDTLKAVYSLVQETPRSREFRRYVLESLAMRSSAEEVRNALFFLPEAIASNSVGHISKADSDLDAMLEGLSRVHLCAFAADSTGRIRVAQETRDRLAILQSNPRLLEFSKEISGRISPGTESELDLSEVRETLARDEECDLRQEMASLRSCDRVSKSIYASTIQKSEALYLKGVIHLRTARENGDLARLWHGQSNLEGTRLQFETHDDSSIQDAKSCFRQALSCRGPASELLSRNIIRCLALVSGPDRGVDEMSSWEMVHSSVGSSSRQRVWRALFKEQDDSDSHEPAPLEETVQQVLQSFDEPFFSNERNAKVQTLWTSLERLLPSQWRVVAIVLCPTGELLLNSIENDERLTSRTVCVFPSHPSMVYDTMMQPLDELIFKSQDQLQDEGSGQSGEEDDETRKREWWSRREKIDSGLEQLAINVDNNFFRSQCARTILRGEAGGSEEDNRVNDWEGASSIPASFAGESPLKHLRDPSKMLVVDLREALIEMGMSIRDLRNMRKTELVDLLMAERGRRHSKPKTPVSRQHKNVETNDATILVLDEDLHRFPFEALCCLRDKIVCRSPSLSFATAKLLETSPPGPCEMKVEPRSASYILDPESNLQGTRGRIEEFLQSKMSDLGCEWEGIVGMTPTEEFFQRNLSREESLLLFFGHGGGQAYFSRSAIEGMIDPGNRKVRASVVLMGCSSGSLVSVNRKKTTRPCKVPLHYEPEGIALSYIAAGAPCVIGNLWDVTDRDIDRLAMDLLSSFWATDNRRSLAACLAAARSSCKMKFINGYAPVYYGLPVFPKAP